MSVTVVLVAGGGAAWEAGALEVLAARSGVVVLKRCVDVDDLLAAASSGRPTSPSWAWTRTGSTWVPST